MGEQDQARGVELRPAVASDLDAVVGLVQMLATSFEPRRAAVAEQLSEVLQMQSAGDRGSSRLTVASCEGAVVGYCLAFLHPTLHANGPVVWVEELVVAPEHRRTGVGTALMADAESWARTRGAVVVALATRRAAAFYSTLGYEESAAYLRKVLVS